MKAEAANSFLKILEEPPPKLVFVLTTQSLSSLLPTVVSRTRILRCHSVPQKDLYPLVEGLDSADSSFILHLAQGAPGVIDRFRNHPEELVAEKQLQSTARQFWDTTSLQKRLYILQALKNKDKESDALLFHLALALREQPISVRSKYADSFFELLRNKKTNAQAQLLSQNFVLALGS
jgi:DNA polymerase-3 subunit delta'